MAAAQKKAAADAARAVKALAEAAKDAAKEQEKLEKAAEELNDRLEDQRRHLLKLPTDEAIRDFEELTRVWAGLSDEAKQSPAVIKRFRNELESAAKAGNKLDAAQREIIKSTKTAKIPKPPATNSRSPAWPGRWAEQPARRSILSLRCASTTRCKGQAAAAGKESEAQFGKMRLGAGKLAFAFSAIGESIGGTAGKVVSELSTIASAFATGGVAGGIIAGAISLGKKIFGIFSRGRKKRKAARRAAAQARLDAIIENNRKIAEEQQRFNDSVYGSAIGAYDRAKAAGIAAYEAVYQASVKSGIGQGLAIALATQAQLEASDKILIAEGEKFVRLAAFEAALNAIRSGNAAGAAAAAEKAAADTRDAWLIGLTAVEEADKVTSEAMMDNSAKVSSAMIADARRARVAQVADANAARVARERAGRVRWADHYSGYRGGDGTGEDWQMRQHGGPVLTGRPYLVGEAGPEIFVPSQSGRIEPNGSGGGAADPRVLAQAVKDSLEGTAIEVDGRRLGRLTIRHQPLAVAELGGRR